MDMGIRQWDLCHVCVNTLHHTAPHCNTLQSGVRQFDLCMHIVCAFTHCNTATLQHTATRSKTGIRLTCTCTLCVRQHTVILQHAAARWNDKSRQCKPHMHIARTSTHCNTATICNTLQHTAIHTCGEQAAWPVHMCVQTLQHCTTLQRTH